MKHDTHIEHPLLSDALSGGSRAVLICKTLAAKQIVYGVVYAPGEIDTDGETMMAQDIEDMSHRFMKRVCETKGQVIDSEHDNIPVGAYPVASYIEESDDKDWPAGSWVLGVKIEDPIVWAKVEKGDINGFSFEALTKKLPAIVEISADQDTVGKTSVTDKHDHMFFLEFNEEGRVIGGMTSFDLGHRHMIKAGTGTMAAQGPGLRNHSHRLPV